MGAWRAFRRGAAALLRSGPRVRDIDDEVRTYLDEAVAELRAQGLSSAEARREARLRYGDAVSIREQVQCSGWEYVAATFAADLRFAARRLRRTPGFTFTTALILALGIGASTAIFSVIYPLLFAPLDYPDSERLVLVLENGRASVGTFAMYRTLATGGTALQSIAVARHWQPALTGTDIPERLDAQRVSADYLTVLGVVPAAGRNFTAADDRAGAENVAIISHGLWRRRFGGEPGIVGREIFLDGERFAVIGVMPASFDDVLSPAASVWAPLQYDVSLPAAGREWGHHLVTVARLNRGVTLSAASEEASRLGRAMVMARRPPTYDPRTRITLGLLRTELVSSVRPLLMAVAGAVALVLLIACANASGLLLARGGRRAGEIAMRVALGASRARIASDVLTETLLVAIVGGIAGVAIAAGGTRALLALAPGGLARLNEVHVDARTLAFAVLLTTIVGTVAGLIPIFAAVSRFSPQSQMQIGSTRTTRAQGRAVRLLVAGEVALALVLLVGAGLLLRSVRQLLSVPMGFAPNGLLTLQAQAVGPAYATQADVVRFFDQAIDAVGHVPGVTAAAATSQLPLSGDRDEYGAGFPAAQGLMEQRIAVFRYAVSSGYFQTAGIPILRGRGIDAHDTAQAPPIVVISEALARERFGDQDPLGQTLTIGPKGPFTIVGVAGNVRQVSLALGDADAVYVSPAQWPFPETSMTVVARVRGNPASFAHDVQSAVWTVDRNVPISRLATMDSLVRASASERRFALVIFETFAFVSLVLAAVGLYGLLAGNVAARVREIGVRAALGATRAQIVVMVVRQGLSLTAMGIAAGMLAAGFATRALATLLFGVSRLDPWTYAGVTVLLGAVAFVAASLPAWRASRVDPSLTLRTN